MWKSDKVNLISVLFSGGEVTEWTQSAQHSENTWEDADRKQKLVAMSHIFKHCVRKTESSLCAFHIDTSCLVVALSSPASPYYRTKLRGLYTTAKADAEAECRWVATDEISYNFTGMI